MKKEIPIFSLQNIVDEFNFTKDLRYIEPMFESIFKGDESFENRILQTLAIFTSFSLKNETRGRIIGGSAGALVNLMMGDSIEPGYTIGSNAGKIVDMAQIIVKCSYLYYKYGLKT